MPPLRERTGAAPLRRGPRSRRRSARRRRVGSWGLGFDRRATFPRTRRTYSLPMALTGSRSGKVSLTTICSSPFAVAQVDEGQAAQLAHVVHPAVDGDFRSGQFFARRRRSRFPVSIVFFQPCVQVLEGILICSWVDMFLIETDPLRISSSARIRVKAAATLSAFLNCFFRFFPW